MLTTPPEESFASFCRLHRLAPDLLARALSTEIVGSNGAITPAYQVEVGAISQKEFDAYMAEFLSSGLERPLDPEGLTNRLIGEMRPVRAMALGVRRLKEAGVLTALLSNSWGQEYPMEALSKMFHEVVVSAQVGLRKPQPEIYGFTAELLKVDPAECVFVDDVAANVAAAEAFGMTGILHASPEVTLDSLAHLFGGQRLGRQGFV